MDPRPSIVAAMDAFGVDVTVTPPGGAAFPTRAFWLAAVSAESPPGREERRHVLVLPLDGLPQVLRGTIVSAPEYEGAAATDWKVDAAERVDFDHYRATVVPA